MGHRVTSGENCCLQLEMGDAKALGWQCSHGRVSTTGWEEAVLGSSSVALNSATYLSFLEGLLGQQALLQPCEGVVGREQERGETPSQGETGLLVVIVYPAAASAPHLNPFPAKQGPKGTAPAPGHRALFHSQELGKLRHTCPPAHAVQRRRPSCVARAGKHGSGDAGLGRGQRMEASPGHRQGALVGLGCALAPSRVV